MVGRLPFVHVRRSRPDLLCAIVLSCLSACVGGGGGYRWLGTGWEPFDGQVAFMAVPSGWVVALLEGEEVKWRPDLGLAGSFWGGSESDGGALVGELFAGVWVPIWHRDWEPSEGGYCVHGGVGVSWLEGRLQRDSATPEDTDWCWAGYARLGYLFGPRETGPAGLSCVGVEVRYTFGSRLELDGNTLSADGMQFLFCVYTEYPFLP